jgi:hypothetical protein
VDIVVTDLAFLLATVVLAEEAAFVAYSLLALLAAAVVSVVISERSLVLSLLWPVQDASAPAEIAATIHNRVTIFAFRIKISLVKQYKNKPFKSDAIAYMGIIQRNLCRISFTIGAQMPPCPAFQPDFC